MVMVLTLEEEVLLSYWHTLSNDLVLSPLSVVAIELTDGLLTLTDLQDLVQFYYIFGLLHLTPYSLSRLHME